MKYSRSTLYGSLEGVHKIEPVTQSFSEKKPNKKKVKSLKLIQKFIKNFNQTISIDGYNCFSTN